jgi:hypothetical protein
LWNEFHRVVNMSSRELGEWLCSRGAQSDVEALPDQAGTPAGQRVLAILGKRRTDLNEDDARVMRAVVERVHVERANRKPLRGRAHWRRRLMSLGHDP